MTGIFLGEDFLSVNKKENANWEDVKHIVISLINEFYSDGKKFIMEMIKKKKMMRMMKIDDDEKKKIMMKMMMMKKMMMMMKMLHHCFKRTIKKIKHVCLYGVNAMAGACA